MGIKHKGVEIPILFSTPMVQAILDGRKTMTRRVVGEDKRGEWTAFNDVRKNSEYGASVPCYLNREISIDDKSRNIMYPKYDVGDKLWVRETWAYIDRGFGGDAGGYVYRASENGQLWETETEGWRWRPSIHMPKEAARIWLEVTNVRVERLQDITEEDARVEGVSFEEAMEFSGWSPSYNDPDGSNAWPNYREAFKHLWDSLNKKRGYGFEYNPWVWIIEFEVKKW